MGSLLKRLRILVKKLFRPRPSEYDLIGAAPAPVIRDQRYADVVRDMRDYGALGSRNFLNRREAYDRTSAHPEIVRFAQALCAEMADMGVPYFVHNVYRGEAEQEELFRKGVTKARFGSSAHNYGMAADIVHYGRYWQLTTKEWAFVGVVGKEVARRLNLRVVWGGDWSFYDPAHWELEDWRERVQRGEAPAP